MVGARSFEKSDWWVAGWERLNTAALVSLVEFQKGERERNILHTLPLSFELAHTYPAIPRSPQSFPLSVKHSDWGISCSRWAVSCFCVDIENQELQLLRINAL